MIQGSMRYVTEQAEIRDSGNPDNFITESLADTVVPDLRTDDWLSYYADIIAGGVQYGGAADLCAYLKPYEGDDQVTIANALVTYGADSGTSPDQYDRTILASTVIDPYSSGRPWNFQVCTEYGWF